MFEDPVSLVTACMHACISNKNNEHYEEDKKPGINP